MSGWYPHLTVAVVVESEGKYLLVEEIAEGCQVLNQPAGHLEKDETLMEAAIRETLEETGWTISVDFVTGFYLYTSPHNQITYFRCCFAATAVRHDQGATLDDGIIGIHWLTLEELRKSDNLRSPLVLKCIEDYCAGQQILLGRVAAVLLPIRPARLMQPCAGVFAGEKWHDAAAAVFGAAAICTGARR